MSSNSSIKQFRYTQSPYKLTSYNDALDILNKYELKLGEHRVHLDSIEDCFSLIDSTLSETVVSKTVVPETDVSKVDGYIFNANHHVKSMPIITRIVQSLEEFEKLRSTKKDDCLCCPVNTGQTLPLQDYNVIPVEDTEFVNDCYVKIMNIPQGQQYVRKEGSDINLDDTLPVGTKIGPAEIAVILAMRQDYIKVFDKPRAAVLSTGDELIDPFEAKSYNTGGVVDVNNVMITMLLANHGCTVSQERLAIVADSISAVTRAIRSQLEDKDILVITGGASMGSHDFVKESIVNLGGTVHFGRVNMKPGKPTSFSTLELNGKRKYIFSLPGNPISAYVTCLTLIVPFLCQRSTNSLSRRRLLNFDDIFNIKAVIVHIYDGRIEDYPLEERWEFLRAQVVGKRDDIYEVQVSVKQQSSRLLTTVDSDCLIFAWKSDPSNAYLRLGQIYKGMKLKNGTFCL